MKQETLFKKIRLIYSEDKINIPLIIKEIKKIAFDKKILLKFLEKKDLYSIWKKMQTKKLEWIISQTLWLFELLSKKEDCYKLLSLLHQNYTAIMGRFKDYISAPKRNGYQSLHTGLIGPKKLKLKFKLELMKWMSLRKWSAAHGCIKMVQNLKKV